MEDRAVTRPESPVAGRATGLVRYAALIGAVSSFASIPVAWTIMGPEAALPPLVAGVAFAIILQLIRSGALRSASTWLIAMAVVGAGFVHLANGGLRGWTYPLLVILPMLAILVERRSQVLGLQVGLAVSALLAVTYVLPDGWLYGAPPPDETIWSLRLGFQIFAILTAGSVATYAIRRLESAVAEAQATEQRANHAATRKTSFLANISHELRTPLNAIQGYSELILEEPSLSREARSDVQRIRTAGEELLVLINEVLQHARLDATGSGARETRQLDGLLTHWVDASRGLLAVRSDRPRRGHPSVVVHSDATRLSQVVSHVVDGYRRFAVPRVDLVPRVEGNRASVLFRPSSRIPATANDVPLPWLLAERVATSLGARVRRSPDGQITLTLPARDPESPRPRVRRRPWTARRHASDPLRDLRAELSVRLAWLSIAILALVGPGLASLYEDTTDALFALLGWGTFLFSVLLLHRVGLDRTAGLTMAFGQLLILTAIQGAFGGSQGAGMVYFPSITVLGILIAGSRSGFLLTALAVAGACVLAVGDLVSLLPVSPLETRFQVLVGTTVATGVTTALVATWSRPLESLVAAANEAAREASQADRATSTFLDVVSLELRTPLNAVLGYSELVLEGDDLEDEAREDLQRILDAGRHLLAVVDDLLDMSAIVADRIELAPEEVELEPLLASVASVVEPMLEHGENVLRIRVDEGVHTVLADPKRLRQILLNLLSNAAKFTKGGTVDVRVALGDQEVVLSVEDTGIGIAEHELPNLFQPFRQVHRASPGHYGGTGLGLAISRQLARLMGGDVQVRSALGVGSTFTVSLPMPEPISERSGSRTGSDALRPSPPRWHPE